jgi:hypothetical protein
MAKPKLPKRPKATAGVGSLEAHLKAIKAVEKRYREKLANAKKAVAAKQREYAKRVALNKAIDKARQAYARMK